MQYLFLFIASLNVALQSIFQKQYASKTERPSNYLFITVTSFSTTLFFLICAKFRFDFTIELLPYCICMGLMLSMGLLGNFLAIRWGSMSLTILLVSYAQVIPMLHGVIFMKQTLGYTAIAGIILLLLSLYMVNDKKSDGPSEKQEKPQSTFSAKWLLAVIVTVVGNGMASVTHALRGARFGEAYRSEFMGISMLVTGVIFLILTVVTRERVKTGFGKCTAFGFLNGTANGITNYFVMVLGGVIPSAILFPSLSAGGVVIGFLTAVFYYKEKLSRLQLVGYLLGTISIILLNI